MRVIVLASLATILAVFGHAWWSAADHPPDLPLALVAWLVVAGDADKSLWRAWLVGTIRDGIDPGSVTFHTLAYLTLALIYFPLRRYVYPRSLVACGVCAALAALALAWADDNGSGLRLVELPALALLAAKTGLAAVWVGWLAEGLPSRLCPLAPGEGGLLR